MDHKYLILLASIFLIGVYSSPVSEQQQQPSDKKLPEEKPPISSVSADHVNIEPVPTSVHSANHSVPSAHNISDGISQKGAHENANITMNILKNNTMNQPNNDSISKNISETTGNTSQATHNNAIPSPVERNKNANASDSALADKNSSSSQKNSSSVVLQPFSTVATPTVPTVITTAIAEKTASFKPTIKTNVSDSVNTNSVVAEHNTPLAEGNHFDGASFVGGIVLTVGLTAIGFIAFKYYKSGRIDMNYRTL